MSREEHLEFMKSKALYHTGYMEENLGDSINLSAFGSKKYTDSDVDVSNCLVRYESTETHVVKDRVEAILEEVCFNKERYGKVAVLNFASYKHPGGGFIRGMMAQEEALCYISGLYNVLSKRKDFYESHPNSLNKGLYTNHALYSDNVPFIINENKRPYTCDVITCAAPNLSPALRYHTLDDRECYDAMDRRIEFIFKVAILNKVDTLIFGAYGCGMIIILQCL